MEPDYEQKDDITGKDRLSVNVFYSWVVELLFVLAGFIIPRMINDHLGAESLGIWDFGWSLVAYFALVQVGVVSSINRFVAKHRANGDTNGINIAISSVSIVLFTMAFIVLVLTIGTVFLFPVLFKHRFENYIVETQFVVLYLGLSLTVQIIWSLFGGILSGFHRWDLHHLVNGGCRLFTMTSMIVVLYMGGSIKYLALVNLIGEIFGLIGRFIFSKRIYKQMSVRWSHFSLDTAKNMIKFGSKNFLLTIGELFSNQAINILIVYFWGPAVLAMYARPRNLIKQAQTFIVRYAFTLAPTASSIQSLNKGHEIRDFIYSSAKVGSYISIPIIYTLAIMGGPVLRIWMGQEYENQALITVMALGYAFNFFQLPTVNILSGMNYHGKVSIVKFSASILGFCSAYFALYVLKFELIGMAAAMILPSMLVDIIYIPYFLKKTLTISVTRYFLEAYLKPMVLISPFIIWILTVRIMINPPLLSLLIGLSIGTIILGSLYWRYVFDDTFKRRIIEFLSFKKKS